MRMLFVVVAALCVAANVVACRATPTDAPKADPCMQHLRIRTDTAFGRDSRGQPVRVIVGLEQCVRVESMVATPNGAAT